MYVHVYEQDNRKKNVECLPLTAEETGEPPWRVRPALGSAVGRCVSWGITECQGGKPTFSRGLLKTQPLRIHIYRASYGKIFLEVLFSIEYLINFHLKSYKVQDIFRN